jgi:putative transposase
MARLPRLVVPNQLHHVIAQGHNDQPIVRDDADHQAFLTWLREAARQSRVAVHAYVVLPSRLQLLATPADDTGLSKMMQSLGRLYVPYFNARYGRTGGLWEGRFRATVLDPVAYFVPCACLIEYQPVSTGLVSDVAAYPWSSHAHHAGHQKEPWLSDHPAYWALGNTPFEREAAYQQVSKSPVDSAVSEKIWLATRKAWALGSDEFCRRLAKLTARRLAPVSRGRPRKVAVAQGAAAAVKPAAKARAPRSSPQPRATTPEKAD